MSQPSSTSRADEVVEEAVRALATPWQHRADREVRPSGHHVDDGVREEQVELAPLDLAGGVVDAAAAVSRRADLRREADRRPPARSRRARRRAPSRASGARPRSGSTRGSSRRTPSSCTRTRPTRRVRGSAARRRRDRRRRGGTAARRAPPRAARRRGRVDEDERAPRVDADGDETERLPLEPGLAVGPGCVAQRAVEGVRPGVVGALDRLPSRVLLAEDVSAVATDVDEAAQFAVARACEDDGERACRRRRELTRLGDLVEAGRVLPARAEETLLLETRDRRVDVPVVRQRAERRARWPRRQSTPGVRLQVGHLTLTPRPQAPLTSAEVQLR